MGGAIRADDEPERLIDAANKVSTVHFDVTDTAALERAQSLFPGAAIFWEEGAGVLHIALETRDPDHALEVLARDRAVRGRRYRVAGMTLEDLSLIHCP